MVGEGFDDAAVSDLPGGAGAYHVFQFFLQGAQTLDAVVDIRQTPSGDAVHLLAGLFRLVGEAQKLGDFPEAKAKLSGVGDEFQPPHRVVVIQALIARIARRRHQADLLVITDCRHLHPRRRRCFPNAAHICKNLLKLQSLEHLAYSQQQSKGVVIMGACCGGSCGSEKFDGVSGAFRRALLMVIVINGVMFVVEMLAGFAGGSMALKSDALDFFGDTATYAISLWAIGKSGLLRARVALLKGVSLGLMGIGVFAATLYRFVYVGAPDEIVMGAVGFAALCANLLSVLLLMRFKDGDANVRSVWLCSRKDAIGNLAVLAAAGAVFFTKSPYPDLIVAALMATLFLNSSRQIIRQALAERRGLIGGTGRQF